MSDEVVGSPVIEGHETAGQAQLEAPSAAEAGMGLVLDIPLQLSVEVGRARLCVKDVLKLAKGSVVELDRSTGDPADVYVNGRLVGRGDLVVVEDRLSVKIVEIAPGASSQP